METLFNLTIVVVILVALLVVFFGDYLDNVIKQLTRIADALEENKAKK